MPESHWNMFDIDVLTWILSGTHTLELLRDFIQMRIAIEPEAAALAAANPDSQEVASIGTALERMYAAEEGQDRIGATLKGHVEMGCQAAVGLLQQADQ